jgi:hypothetical protein
MGTRLAALAGLALFGAVGVAGAQSQSGPPPSAPTQCFFIRDWKDWRTAPGAKSLYVRVGGRRVYRIDLASPCPNLDSPSSRLITRSRSGDSVCQPVDLDLKVSVGPGFSSTCIVSGITELTPHEAAALPNAQRP